jgi:hypothetical protein
MRRDDFVRRLSARLGEAGGAPLPPAPHPSPARPQAIAGGALTELFVERLLALEVRVARCATRAAAEEGVARLVAQRGWGAICGPASLRSQALAGLWVHDPGAADLGLAEANMAIAETGSVVVLSGSEAARGHSLLPPASGFFVAESRLLPCLGDVLRRLDALAEPPSCVSIISGPSTTADINATRCVGVHGPGEVFVWLLAGE